LVPIQRPRSTRPAPGRGPSSRRSPARTPRRSSSGRCAPAGP
jgi:hypothetical protein